MSTEIAETYTVEQIREAWRLHSHPDDWGVSCFYEDGLIAALRGEYDKKPPTYPCRGACPNCDPDGGRDD